MHWKQREMLFEQRETLREQTGTARKRKPGTGKKGNEIARKDARGTPMGGDTPKPPSGKSPKRRSFEGAHEKGEGMHAKKEDMSNQGGSKSGRRPVKKRPVGGGGLGNKPSGQSGRRRPTKRKTESHCEAYAEAYVRGVEAALRESRR